MNKHVSEIWIYPIKSLPGIKLNESQVNFSGLQYDREWMLINTEGKFLTARENSTLLKFSIILDIQTKNLQITDPSGKNSITFPVIPDEGKLLDAEIWGQAIKVIHPYPVVSEFFSENLGQKVLAVYAGKNSERLIDSAQNTKFRINLSDGFPFLVLGDASIRQLSEKYHEAIDIRRFRPNIVFKDGVAFEEDDWSVVKIGNTSFYCERKCARCVMVSYHPETIVYEPEILKLLNTERKEGNKIMVGMNLSLLQGTSIKINDLVVPQIESTTAI